ncbi:MAG: hypothetical protein ACRC7S_06165 [Cetobacterium sp.]
MKVNDKEVIVACAMEILKTCTKQKNFLNSKREVINFFREFMVESKSEEQLNESILKFLCDDK